MELTHHEDDGAFILLRYTIVTGKTNLGRAYKVARRISGEVEEIAHQAADEVGKQIAQVAARLAGWGSESLDGLIDAAETAASADDKGRTLEELYSRLFESVSGFTVTARIRTETEEIDISVLNDSSDPRLRREGALILPECKNWSGKDEFVLFRQKLENRSRRATLGF